MVTDKFMESRREERLFFIADFMKKLFIFDLDGTLVNSIYDLGDAMNAVLVCTDFQFSLLFPASFPYLNLQALPLLSLWVVYISL